VVPFDRVIIHRDHIREAAPGRVEPVAAKKADDRGSIVTR
jgi:hypothetical protein